MPSTRNRFLPRGETDKHPDTELFLQVSFLLTFLVTNDKRQKQRSPPPRCWYPCAPRQEQFPQPLSATNCLSCFPSTQGRGKDHYCFQNETVEKIYNESKAVIVFPRTRGTLCCQSRKESGSGSSSIWAKNASVHKGTTA